MTEGDPLNCGIKGRFRSSQTLVVQIGVSLIDGNIEKGRGLQCANAFDLADNAVRISVRSNP